MLDFIEAPVDPGEPRWVYTSRSSRARNTRAKPDPAPMRRYAVEVDGRRVFGVEIKHGNTVYFVIPVKVDGRPALYHYAETASGEDVLHSERAPLGRDRDYLARVALTFLERDADRHINSTVKRPYAEMRRPSDETLLHTVRRAIAAGASPRRELAEVYGVSVNTADDWIKYARALPSADLPPARRGRPRKTPQEGNAR